MSILASFPVGPLLALDAGGLQSRVGIFRDGAWLSRRSSAAPPLEALFSLTHNCLDDACLPLRDLAGFAFCDGPGSTLGLRLASAALLAWQGLFPKPLPIAHYHSLELAWFPLLRESSRPPLPWLVTDYRKEAWLGAPTGDPARIQELNTDFFADLRTGFYYLPQRKSWAPPPGDPVPVEYPFADLPAFLHAHPAPRLESRPILALPGKSDYRKWAPVRHRAPETP